MAFVPRISTTNPSNVFDSSSVYNNPYYCSANGKLNDHNINTYQCTYWAIARSGEIAGEPVTSYVAYPSNPRYRIWARSGFGDAENWFNDARSYGVWPTSTDCTKPKLGALVCFSGSGWGVAGGHVMVIEEINGSTIRMSENQGCFRQTFLRTWDVSELLNHGFQGYIYNPYIEEPIEYVTIGTSVYPENSGIVTGGGTVVKGSSVTLTAIPGDGYIFNRWNNGSTDNPLIITASESADYVAYMRKRKSNIILMLNYDGTGVQIR